MSTLLDQAQIVKREHDELNSAKKVRIVATELAISTDEAEDSMATRPLTFSQEVEVGDIIDISKHKETVVYFQLTGAATGTLQLEVSPEATGTFFLSDATLNTTASAKVVVPTAALRLRITGTVPNGRLIVVGRG